MSIFKKEISDGDISPSARKRTCSGVRGFLRHESAGRNEPAAAAHNSTTLAHILRTGTLFVAKDERGHILAFAGAITREARFHIQYADTYMSSAQTPFFDPTCYVASGSDLF